MREVSDVSHLTSSDYHKIMMIAPSNHKWKLLSDCRLRSDKQIIALFVGGLLRLRVRTHSISGERGATGINRVEWSRLVNIVVAAWQTRHL